MARTEFPVWRPSPRTLSILRSGPKAFSELAKRRYYQALRTSSRGFIGRKEVRSFIFNRDFWQCVNCGSIDNLEVDHIITVFSCFQGKIPYLQLNTETNLQTLCKTCNAQKPV